MEKKDFIQCYFRFEITQNVKVLLYKIEKGDGRRWNVEKNKDVPNRLELTETDNPSNRTETTTGPGYMQIITACSGYSYLIEDRKGGGAEVHFAGPVNGLLAQALMPRMTYVPHTLTARSEDMPDYVPIDEFMAIRAERNAAEPNPQDLHGWRVNMKFNNELVPYLPPFNGNMRESEREKRRKKTGKFARR